MLLQILFAGQGVCFCLLIVQFLVVPVFTIIILCFACFSFATLILTAHPSKAVSVAISVVACTIFIHAHISFFPYLCKILKLKP